MTEPKDTSTRTPRANSTREKTAQRKPWAPPSMLEAPPAPDGYKHRWIRAEVRGFDDRKNISAKLRGGGGLVGDAVGFLQSSMLCMLYALILIR